MSESVPRRRQLEFSKCTFCRKDKKKCEPLNRDWPRQKCRRCLDTGRPCSASIIVAARKSAATRIGHMATRNALPAAIEDTLDELNQSLWDFLKTFKWLKQLSRSTHDLDMIQKSYECLHPGDQLLPDSFLDLAVETQEVLDTLLDTWVEGVDIPRKRTRRAKIVTLSDQQPGAAELSDVPAAPAILTQTAVEEDARDSSGLERNSCIIGAVSEDSEYPLEYSLAAIRNPLGSLSVPSVPPYSENNFDPYNTFLKGIESKYPPLISFIDSVIWGSHVFSPFKSTESPWQAFVWPLARLNPAILHAVFSVASFHASEDSAEYRAYALEHTISSIGLLDTSERRAEYRAYALEHMTISITLLDASLVNIDLETMSPEAAIAAALVLSVSTSYRDSYTSTGRSFIRQAGRLLGHAMSRRDRLSAYDLTKLMFLFGSWLYMDVITGLTITGQANHYDLEDLEFSSAMSSNISHFDSADGHPTGQLMGCALTLFPIIGQTISLAKSMQANDQIPPQSIESAEKIDSILQGWLPHMPSGDPYDWRVIQDCFPFAEAYRWATHLYLRRVVRRISVGGSVRMARMVLSCLALIPPDSPAVLQQIYPLLSAGCELKEEEAREWIRKRWKDMAQRMPNESIAKCEKVLEEVWRRRDACQAWKPAQSCTERAQIADYWDKVVRVSKSAGEYSQIHWNTLSISAGLILFDEDIILTEDLHWLGVMRDWNWEVRLG